MKVTNLWSAGWMEKIPGGEHLSIRRCPAARAQASLILTIPNYLLSRQEKSLVKRRTGLEGHQNP